MIRRPPRSTLFPYTTSSDRKQRIGAAAQAAADFEDGCRAGWKRLRRRDGAHDVADGVELDVVGKALHPGNRSEDDASDLQSPDQLVCRLVPDNTLSEPLNAT